jgi:hypothetical protein
VKAKYLWWVAGAVAAYIVYETWIVPAHAAAQPDGVSPLPSAGATPNADMGGLNFGALDPSTW